MTDPRDLIKRLAEELDTWLMAHHHGGAPPEIQHATTLVVEARAALTQPEPERPTDEPLGDLIDKWVQEAFRKKPHGCKHPTHTYVAGKAWEHGRNQAARAYLAQPKLTLTVEDCSNMHKHWFNYLDENCPGQIILDGCFTREDLIEIANTVPTTEA